MKALVMHALPDLDEAGLRAILALRAHLKADPVLDTLPEEVVEDMASGKDGAEVKDWLHSNPTFPKH
eukprot:5298485-Lingulodinium_polyedra.AAC.1